MLNKIVLSYFTLFNVSVVSVSKLDSYWLTELLFKIKKIVIHVFGILNVGIKNKKINKSSLFYFLTESHQNINLIFVWVRIKNKNKWQLVYFTFSLDLFYPNFLIEQKLVCLSWKINKTCINCKLHVPLIYCFNLCDN